jgi:hypothetical protein
MLSLSIKRKATVTPSTPQNNRRLIFETPIRRLVFSDVVLTAKDLFIFSPFGLCCRTCNTKIQLDERSIREHLNKHKIDSRAATVRPLFEGFLSQCEIAKASGTVDNFRVDNVTHTGYACFCGTIFAKKGNIVRHCRQKGCDKAKIQQVELFKLCCGQYVTQAQVDTFLNDTTPRINQQLDYEATRAVLVPFLPENEKRDNTYTHMYTPLVAGCGGHLFFAEKIRKDFVSIHSAPDPSREWQLLRIHEQAKEWLLKYANDNIMMLPGNLRAGLQTFDGGDINDLSHGTTYALQHDPRSLLPELQKLLSFAYRRGLFATRGFNEHDKFAIAYFLKNLMLEVPPAVSVQPFVAEFCLMWTFRVNKSGTEIYMISCDAVSSLLAKVLSLLRAAVCSVICSFSKDTFTTNGPGLVRAVRDSPVIHILSPMIRQIRDMNRRIPKRRKTTLDAAGNITVDQFAFPFDDWSDIVPRTLELMRMSLTELANGV